MAEIPDDLSSPAVRLIRARAARHALVLEGTLPTTTELLDGSPFFKDSIERDVQVWCDTYLQIGMTPELTAALETLRDTKNSVACELVLDADAREKGLGRERERVRIYAAMMGDAGHAYELKIELLQHAGQSEIHSFSNFVRRAVGEGMGGRVFSMARAFEIGAARLRDLYLVTDKWQAAAAWVADGEPEGGIEPAAKPTPIVDDDEFLIAVAEDRAEFYHDRKGVVVVPSMGPAGTRSNGDIQKLWKGLEGKPLPLVMRGNVFAHRTALVSRWPHATDIIDTILGDLAAVDPVRFRPTVLVGPPGSGKTSLLRKLAETLGLPVETVSLSGMADASAMGTSAQWSTARESIPLQLIRKSKTANPVVIWDELEKVSPDRRNGNALEALLPMLERDQARHFRDLALEVEVDLSMVSHFGTANDLDAVPAPLRDRMRILVMPEPTWEHVGTLVSSIVESLMFERGLDFRWIEPLGQDELDLIRRAWSGGSIRQLERIVTTLIDGRDATWGNA